MKITQKRDGDAIRFYSESGCEVATLYDDMESIMFDEMAYIPTKKDIDDLFRDESLIENHFKSIGLDASTARLIDSMPTLDINSK